ncbi:hypothetical protein PIB30_050360 [Stylosanthes scabra]|uniref:Uncharacterized protein n=1 Tax=Stylosanthes scabra TaxID=79078 RepID=A0ABU6ZGB9_9FABA|nr:hypothetical protein [Stylosanthes scabra]
MINFSLSSDIAKSMHRYYQGDPFRVANLQEELYALKQGELNVTGVIRSFRAEDQITRFLKELNKQYSSGVRSQVMLMDRTSKPKHSFLSFNVARETISGS